MCLNHNCSVGGRWTNRLTFKHLMRNLLRCIRFLSYFRYGADLNVEVKEVKVHFKISSFRVAVKSPAVSV